MKPVEMFSLKDLCSALQSPPESTPGILWSVITTLWPWGWFLIIAILVGVVIYELNTRYGTAHYNSENGFSPGFNSFVGSGTYLGLQTLIYLLLRLVFGEGVYCAPWPYALHITVFVSTGLFLHVIGFWPRLVEPGRRKPRRRRSRRS